MTCSYDRKLITQKQKWTPMTIGVQCEESQNHNIGGGKVRYMDRAWFHLYECQKQEKQSIYYLLMYGVYL